MTVKSAFEAMTRRWSISNVVAIPASVALLKVGLSGDVAGTDAGHLLLRGHRLGAVRLNTQSSRLSS